MPPKGYNVRAEGSCEQLDVVVSRWIEFDKDRGAVQFARHIPQESGEGRLIILNFKRRPTVTVEVKDLGEVNEGWRGNRLLESRPEGANLTSIRVPETNHNGRIIKESGG
jgi:hypothetical protein